MSNIATKEFETKLEETIKDFNIDAEKLGVIEQEIIEAKDKSLVVLREIARRASGGVMLASLEGRFEEADRELQEKELEHHKLLKTCYRKLNNVRQLQVNYLSGVVNGLQAELKKAKGEEEVEEESKF